MPNSSAPERTHSPPISGLARTAAVLLLAGLLSACAAVVVGGAATGAAVANDRRSTATFFEDKELLGLATGLRDADSELAASSNVDITVYNLQVLLSGATTRPELARAFAQRVAALPGTRRVFNEVVQGSPGDLPEAARDAYLTTAVNASLLGIELAGFDPTRVKVTTTNATVFLMGLVTHAEADAATGKARHVHGVRKVVRLFEYTGG